MSLRTVGFAGLDLSTERFGSEQKCSSECLQENSATHQREGLKLQITFLYNRILSESDFFSEL